MTEKNSKLNYKSPSVNLYRLHRNIAKGEKRRWTREKEEKKRKEKSILLTLETSTVPLAPQLLLVTLTLFRHCHVSLFTLNIKIAKTWTLFSNNVNTIITKYSSRAFISSEFRRFLGLVKFDIVKGLIIKSGSEVFTGTSIPPQILSWVDYCI